MSLTLDQGEYPRNALAPVSVDVHNLSKHSVTLLAACGYPKVQVITRQGKVVYPQPQRRSTDVGHCPPAFPQPIPSSGYSHFEGYLVLRSGLVRVYWPLASGNPAVAVPRVFVGKTLHVRLFKAAAPKIVFYRGNPPRARVSNPGAATGNPWYIDSALCRNSRAQTVSATPTTGQVVPTFYRTYSEIWRPAPTRTIRSPCPRLVEWDLAAAWIGHPVATVHYRS